MNKNGFTLVELLAVIVILAVLALIATPVVLSIIDDAKESAMLRSAEMYLSGVENAVMRENMNSGGNFRPSECSITNGNMTCGSTNVEVEVDGEVPSTGSITFENGKIKEVTLNYTSGTIVKDSSGSLVYEGSETLEPGFYREDGTFISWQELIDDEAVTVNNNGYFSAGGFTDRYESYAYNNDKLVLPNTVTTITENSFADGYIDLLVIPTSVVSIETGAFNHLLVNMELYYKGTMEQWNKIIFGDSWSSSITVVHCTDGDIEI